MFTLATGEGILYLMGRGLFDGYYSQIQSITDSYKNLVSNGSISVGHTIIETEKAPILCETYRFTSLGAYLYFELFKCIEEKHMPAEKIKSDPVWLIYTRAYKQHYARFMKKTMSKTEFAAWAEYALTVAEPPNSHIP